MSFNVSGLTDYVQANEKQLIGKMVLTSKTLGLITPQVGVKGSAYVNVGDFQATLQAGSCSWTPAGSTTFSQRTIETSVIEVNEELCGDDLKNKALSYDIHLGVGVKTLPFEEEIINGKIASVQAKIECMVWQGNKSAASGDTFVGISNAEAKLMDGINKLADAASASTVDASPVSGKSLTVLADVIDIVDNAFLKIPKEIVAAQDLKIFMGLDAFQTYVLALRKANLYHVDPQFDGTFEMYYPGTKILVVGVAGLNSDSTHKPRLYATTSSNLVYGVDMLGDAEKFKFGVANDFEQMHKILIKFNLGVQIAVPEYLVVAKCS